MKSLLKSAWVRLAITLSATLGAASAWAAPSCTQSVVSISISTPPGVSIPRDAPIGTAITGWLASEAATNWFNCVAAAGESTGVGIRALTASTGQTTVVDGATYTVFSTATEGVGVILSVRIHANGCGWGNFSAVTSATSWHARGCNSPGAVSNGGQLRTMYVKTGNITTGTVAPTAIAYAASFTSVPGSPLTLEAGREFSFTAMAMLVATQACRTPDVHVSLGEPKSSVFTGKGSSSNTVAFDFTLESCPAGMGAIHYQIDAVTPVLDAANAVVALDGGSTATGVGVQLMDENGNPALLGTKRPFTGYTGVGGNFKIPLRARYRQTGDKVTPGSANAAVTITMNYL